METTQRPNVLGNFPLGNWLPAIFLANWKCYHFFTKKSILEPIFLVNFVGKTMARLRNITKPSHVEEWKPAFGWEEAYEISSMGKIRSVKTGRMLKFSKDRYGHPIASLSFHGKRQTVMVRVLVMNTFHENKTHGKRIFHRDGNPENVTVNNLFWED